MNQRKLYRLIAIVLIFLVIFFIGYAAFFRTYLSSEQYLQMAWDYTGHDPHVLNWREPEAEVIWRDGRIVLHLVLHTDEDIEHGPYSLYIDPFKKAVIDADLRSR